MSVYSLLGAPQLGQMYTRLIFALDVATVPEALELVQLLRNEVGMFKIGKQLFLHAGPEFVREIKQHGGDVFLDLKFHDIPRTVAKAGAEATRLGVRMFDLHASGSVAMMRQTIAEVNKVCRTEHLVRPKLLAVTVLTSLDRGDLDDLGFDVDVEKLVVSRARRALEAGCDGVIASGLEAPALKRELGDRLLVVTPGIRPVLNRANDDQKRTVDVAEAFENGADYIVVGRPIRQAPDPRAAAQAIQATIARVFSA